MNGLFDLGALTEEKFGEIIRLKRKKKAMTQERLSEVVGISDAYLRDIESGRSTVGWTTWIKLCKALDIDFFNI